IAPARAAVAADVAAQVVALLDAGTQVVPRGGGLRVPLAPEHLAVLVRTNKQAELVQAQLLTAGVPVVLTGRSDVFATPAAAEWQLLLEALEQPHRSTRVRRFALGALIGQTAGQLLDDDSDQLSLRLRGWARVLEQRGVSALFEAVCLEQAVQPRLLATIGGDRLLTDLRHLTEALHEAALDGQLGLTALLGWLRQRRTDAGGEGAQERSRRLESDDDAVQVITIHTSKWLEFPVVLVPFAWDCWTPDAPDTVVFHDDADCRVRDVGGVGSPGWREHVQAHKQDEVDDELRLAYVAFTRAQGQLLLWWAGSSNTPTSPLHRLLLHDDPDGVPPRSVPVPSDDDALAVFRARAAVSDDGLRLELVPPPSAARFSAPPRPVPSMSRAVLSRGLDTSWRRTSYTALTSAAHAAPPALGSEPEVAEKQDEDDGQQPDDLVAASPPPDATVSSWDALPGGPSFGTLVHEVLEQLEDPQDDAAVAELVQERAARWSPDLDAPLLSEGLLAALRTPLGPLADDRPLRDLHRTDRLPELDFELPLAGGDDALPVEVLLADLVPLWREHVPTGLLSGYPDALAALEPAPLRGYLTGSIDAVLRVGSGATLRYLVVDYKTNRLGARGRPLTSWDYRPEAMEVAMVDAHYPLQALLYDVALHRFLRWRQSGYDPQVHLGGALYLFLRGMTGGPGGAGVFAWRPPSGLVTATSDLLAGLR
ncbi:MAG: exodeoxyribonuclease, partial [Frankiales bacterium]|nr:exodeoxyribonuclease [Frankiales bacterium]